MSRSSRIVYPGAIYHIIQRGNNKDYILQEDKHKGFFIKQIKEYNIKFDFQLLAYVIMDNHYHLLIKTNNDSISDIMFYLNNTVGKYLGRELNRTGHIFQGRFTSELVDTDAYLIWCLRYIHRNPVKAHMCKNVDSYKWSSHYYYRKGISSFVDSDFILKVISENKRLAIKQYLELVNRDDHKSGPSADYEEIKRLFNYNDKPLFYNNQDTIIPEKKSLDEILISLNFDSEFKELIKSGSSKHLLTPYKIEFIKTALSSKYTLKEIGEFLSISQSAMSKFLSRHNITTNP